MVVTRSKSVTQTSLLIKAKRGSLGSLSSLAEKPDIPDGDENKLKNQFNASRSLDVDLDTCIEIKSKTNGKKSGIHFNNILNTCY